ncbi:MAG: pentapeptide repeat-containing protein [Alphaproteobacteria bacterium]
MSDTPKRPHPPADANPQAGESHEDVFRQISDRRLKEILKLHQEWVDSGGERGRRANLLEVNLRAVDFSGANLQGARLSGVNLQEANLEAADLGNADLSEANLKAANLREANL